jgi:hypothetical protein
MHIEQKHSLKPALSAVVFAANLAALIAAYLAVEPNKK